MTRARSLAVEFDEVLATVQLRDEIDSGRALAPLRAAEDAEVVDTTALGIEAVLDRVLALVDAWPAVE